MVDLFKLAFIERDHFSRAVVAEAGSFTLSPGTLNIPN